MVTRKELEEFRDGMRELAEMRAKMRQAQLEAMETERESDRDRAQAAAALYDAMAEVRAQELIRIEVEIDGLPTADQRRAVRMRYVDGLSRVQVAARMHLSEAMVDKHVAAAIKEMERE